MKKIDFFISDENMYNSIPHPQPASKFIPSWYKSLPSTLGDPNTNGTIKKCIPFLDCFTTGYIIPLWHDIHFKTHISENNEPRVEFNWPGSLQSDDPIMDHNVEQISGSEMSQTNFGNFPLKFMNPWNIKTPPGYSCLFVQPLNHHNDLFEIISGIVDTDTYTDKINFPFIWHKENYNDVLKKGMPLVQVIPFKRDDWKSNVQVSNSKNKTEFESVNLKIKTVFRDGYKRSFWTKKRYK